MIWKCFLFIKTLLIVFIARERHRSGVDGASKIDNITIYLGRLIDGNRAPDKRILLRKFRKDYHD
jgi:hypothetical protein